MTTATNKKAIKAAVQAHLTSNVSLDDTAAILFANKVGVMDIQGTIQTVGKANGWILTTEKIQEKVKELVKGKTISHFLDVVQLAKTLDLAQMSQAEKQKAIVDFSGVKKSDVREGKKFKQLHNSGNHGTIAEWILSNPDFTASELHSSGVITAPNAGDYYDEFLAYREFFSAVV